MRELWTTELMQVTVYIDLLKKNTEEIKCLLLFWFSYA